MRGRGREGERGEKEGGREERRKRGRGGVNMRVWWEGKIGVGNK